MSATSTEDGIELDETSSGSTTAVVVPTRPPAAPAPPASIAPAPTNTPADTPIVAGAGLIAEAELAVDERRWRDALRVLGAIDSINASSVHTDGLLAIAATHLNKHRLAGEAVGRIRAHPQTASSHRHLAQVAIAKHQYLLADNETRAAFAKIESDSDAEVEAQDWVNLSACYAGLGWFDVAGECLDRAEELGTTDAANWLVGRSTNHWGMSKTFASVIGVVLFIVVGLLALAVAITVPFMVREFRVTQLDERFAVLANDAWSHERWLRLAHASGVLLTVVLWSVATQLT